MVLFSVVGLALWGLSYYYDFIVQQFGWSRAQVTSGNALSKLVVGPLFGFFAGWLVDRFGPRRLMMAGVLMAGTALIGLGSISSLGMFYFFYFFNALGYVCGGPLPNQVLLTRSFEKSRGKAMGIALGWQAALRTLGFLVIVIAFPLAFFLKEPPTLERPAAIERISLLRSAFRRAPFYLLLVGSMCSIAAVSGTQQNLKLFLTLDMHYGQGQATRVLSLVLASSMVGRLLMGWLADRFPKKYIMLLIYMLVACAIPFLLVSRLPILLYAFAILFGVGLGGDYMIIPLLAAELFDAQMLGRVLGVILTTDGVAEGVAPWIVGHIRDFSGSYSNAFLLMIAIALLGSVAISFLPKRAVSG